MINKMPHRFFWISIISHILITFYLSWFVFYKPMSEINSATYLPAYMYHSSVPNSLQKALEKRHEKRQEETKEKIHVKKSEGQISHNSAHPWNSRYTSEKDIAKPLLKLLHDATAQNLIYPDLAMEFNENGIVEIGFLLEPNGTISQVLILKSSGFDLLDKTALNAVKQMSPVKNVNVYLTHPTLLAVDVIFNKND